MRTQTPWQAYGTPEGLLVVGRGDMVCRGQKMPVPAHIELLW